MKQYDKLFVGFGGIMMALSLIDLAQMRWLVAASFGGLGLTMLLLGLNWHQKSKLHAGVFWSLLIISGITYILVEYTI